MSMIGDFHKMGGTNDQILAIDMAANQAAKNVKEGAQVTEAAITQELKNIPHIKEAPASDVVEIAGKQKGLSNIAEGAKGLLSKVSGLAKKHKVAAAVIGAVGALGIAAGVVAAKNAKVEAHQG